MARRQEGELGLVSLVGAVACAVIASELWSDLTVGTEHFPGIPRVFKVIALLTFGAWTVLETQKVRKRVAHVLAFR